MKRYILFFIVLLAFFLRIYKVHVIPPSLSWDEVSIGYNAYSILKTGFDEHHRFLPIDAFAGFGDYKPPLPIYLTVASVALFGLNEFSVRLPSVIAGTLTVLLTYILVRSLFGSSTTLKKHGEQVAFISAFLLALSPWHIQLSRGGFEANIAVCLIILGVVLLLRARENAWYFFVGWLPFVASIYTFNSARYFSPLLAPVLCLYLWPTIVRAKKKFLVGVCVGMVFLLPITPHLLSKEARLRFAEVNIFTDLSVVEKANERIAYKPGLLTNILHNRRVGYIRSYLVHYFDHFQPWFLFTRGDGNPKFSIQDVGQLYSIELPFFVLGLLMLFYKDKRVAWLICSWMLLSIVPAAVARETPHALRIENSLPTWHIFIAMGIGTVIWHWQKLKRYLVMVCIGGAYIWSFSFYWHNYYRHYAIEYSGEWQYGYREAFAYVQTAYDQYDTIMVTDAIGRPYMYALFYLKYDPQKYWDSVDASFDAAGFYNVYGFDKFIFVRNQEIGKGTGRVLYVLSPNEVPAGARVLNTIYKLNGEPALHIVNL